MTGANTQLANSTQHAMFATDLGPFSDGTNNHSYSLVSLGSAAANPSSIRKDTTAAADKPGSLSIKHQLIGSGDDEVMSSLLRFDQVVERASDQKQGTDSVYLVVKRHTKLSETTAGVEGLYAILVAFMATAGYKAKFMGGEP